MPTFVVVTLIILLISIAVLLAVTYRGDQTMTCPHCGLAFVTDLFLVGGTTLLTCPFCRRWILATEARDRFEVKKILG
jgi:hypothetical protein